MELHDFQLKTYKSWTTCDVCKNALLGLTKQGYQCVRCRSNAHKKCLDVIQPTSCTPHTPKGPEDDSSIFSQTITPGMQQIPFPNSETKYRDSPEQSGDLVPPLHHRRSISEGSRPGPDLPAPFPPPNIPKTLPRRGTVGQIKVKKKEDLLPRLSQRFEWWQLPKTQQEFIMHLGPLCKLEDFVIDVITWRNPAQNLLVCAVWTLLCLNPHYVVFIPHVIGLFLLNKHYGGTKEETKKKSLSKHDIERRWRWTRNSQILLCEGIDQLWALEKLFSWEEDGNTFTVFQYLLISTIPLAFLAKYIPWRFIFWIGGMALLTMNTALGKQWRESLPEVLAERAKTIDLLKRAFHKDLQKDLQNNLQNTAATSGLSEIVVQIWENERWWVGSGWSKMLHRKERGPWTDKTGKIGRPSIKEFVPPEGFTFVDDDWKIDTEWSEYCGEEGWCYSDLKWHNPRPDQTMQTMTRRRMWSRRLRGDHVTRTETPPPPSGETLQRVGTLGTKTWLAGIPDPEVNPQGYMQYHSET